MFKCLIKERLIYILLFLLDGSGIDTYIEIHVSYVYVISHRYIHAATFIFHKQAARDCTCQYKYVYMHPTYRRMCINISSEMKNNDSEKYAP